MSLKKDLLWGKYYYGAFEKGKLLDSILYSNCYENRALIEIHSTEARNPELIEDFTHRFAQKKKIRYFLRELNEIEQVEDIDFMNRCGFKRYNHNYCFEFNSKDHKINPNNKPRVFCREAEDSDLVQLMDIDINAQILDYRDQLHKSKKFFKDQLENIYTFVDPIETHKIFAYAFKRESEHADSFDFVIHPRMSDMVFDFIFAFSEKYIHFEKISSSFRFVLNENQKSILPELEKNFQIAWTSQLLIREGIPRERSPQKSSFKVLPARKTSQ